MKKTILQKFRKDEEEPDIENPTLSSIGSPTPGPSREIDNYDDIGFIVPPTPLNLDQVNIFLNSSINQYHNK